MVGDNAERNVGLFIIAVMNAGDLRNLLHDVLDGIDLKEVVNVLHNAGDSFQTHTGIDVGLLHPFIMAFAVGIELGENKVPELNITVAVAAGAAGRLAAAARFSAVEVDLGAGAAGAGAVLPEVILFTEADDMGGIDADFLRPDVERFVIVLIDRDPELINREVEHFGDKFPSPCGRFMLEVIAEREVSEHLEIGAVTGGLADMLDVLSTDTFLAGGDAGIGRGRLTEEEFF